MSSSLDRTPVIVLAGGLGKRLEPVVADRPKPLAQVGSQSFVEIQLGLLRDQGARRFVLCVGHRAGQIQAALGDGSSLGIHIDYSVEKNGLLGTAGALRLALDFFQPRALVLNGDTYLDIDYERLLTHHQIMHASWQVPATIALANLEDSSRYGSVDLDPKENFVVGFREKHAARGGGWLNAGAYVIEKDMLRGLSENTPRSLETHVFPKALQSGSRIAGYPCRAPFFDIGTPEDYRHFSHWYEELKYARHGNDPRRRAG